MKIGYALLLSSVLAFQASANDDLDAPLGHDSGVLQSPIVDDAQVYFVGGTASRSDIMSVIRNQTNVKSQGPRNLCTVFSVTGLVESIYLIATGANDIDLSEEWLHYIYTQGSASGGASGAYQTTLLKNIKTSGMAGESAMPYIASVWEAGQQPRCQNLSGTSLTRCLMAHHRPGLLSLSNSELNNKSSLNYDPEFAAARQSAINFSAFTRTLSGGVVTSTSAIKSQLRQGIPLSLKLKVYYGSWNHSHGDSLGIDRDPNLFALGTVTYPDAGTLDEVKSRGEDAIHSVVIVGYDDNVEVTYNKKMVDGSTRTFTHKGVYYFKNSWGTAKFGSKFKLDGKRIPGFGMIVQDYAHKGEFLAIKAPGINI